MQRRPLHRHSGVAWNPALGLDTGFRRYDGLDGVFKAKWYQNRLRTAAAISACLAVAKAAEGASEYTLVHRVQPIGPHPAPAPQPSSSHVAGADGYVLVSCWRLAGDLAENPVLRSHIGHDHGWSDLDLGQVGEREGREDYISNHCFSHSSSSGSLNIASTPIIDHSCLSRSPYTTSKPSSQ